MTPPRPELLHPDYSRPDLLRLVPAHLQEGLISYIEDGRRPGGALWSIVCNDSAFQVVARLDEIALASIREIFSFLYNYAPGRCWGAPDLCETWCANGGLRGRAGKDAGSARLAPDPQP